MADTRVFIDEVLHSIRGASSAYRWRPCKGSLNLIERMQRDGKKLRTSGEAAAEGTVAHTVYATAMEDGSDGHEFMDMAFATGGWEFIVDDEMADGVQVMLDFVRSCVAADEHAEVHIEKGLQSITDNDAYGTSDFTVVLPTLKKIIIVDLKYGAGIVCEPDSDQTKYYGYLGIENFLPDHKGWEVELFIVQPRIPHPGGVIRQYNITAEDLVAWWFDELLPDMQDTRDPNALLVIGEHCQFCPAKLSCPALKHDTMEMVVDADPCHMTTEEINIVMLKRSAVEKFMESVAGEAYRRALDGEHITGFKVVKKMSKRINKESIVVLDAEGQVSEDDEGNPVTIKFEDAAIKEFGDKAYGEPKLQSIAQLEKLEDGKVFASKWGYMPDNGTTLAPNSDKRAAIQRPMDRFTAEEVV